MTCAYPSNIVFKIVSEMFDVQNRELAQITKADDFIVSDNIISLMITQLSENKNLKKVFDILFTSEGSEIYLKPIVEYVKAVLRLISIPFSKLHQRKTKQRLDIKFMPITIILMSNLGLL